MTLHARVRDLLSIFCQYDATYVNALVVYSWGGGTKATLCISEGIELGGRGWCKS